MDVILIPTTGEHPVTGQHISAQSIVTHDKVRSTIVIQIIQQETITSYRPFCFDPRLRHRHSSRHQHTRFDAPFCYLKCPHGTGQPNHRQRNGDEYFGKTSSSLCVKQSLPPHEDTRPVMLTVKVVS